MVGFKITLARRYFQVEFLNSVIVQLQNKNSELQLRLSAMEGDVVNGAHDDSSA